MGLLISDTVVVTCDEKRRVLEHHAIAVDGGRIVALGPTHELEALYPAFERFDGRRLAVLPGLINAHTHTVLMALRGTVEDWAGDAIYRYMTPVSYVMTAEERQIVATLGCLEAIRSGTTTLVDPFRHVATYAGAMAATGLRLWLSESCADIDTRRIRHGDYAVDEAFGAAFIERASALIETMHGSHGDRVRCQVAAHAPDNCSPAMLAKLNALAARHGLTRTIHLSQSPGEVAAVKALHGLTSAAYLDREGFLGPDLVAAHWTFCTERDIALLAERGVQMAHTPASISRRGAHKALIGPIRDAGVRIAFGTDNMSEDMFQAMAFGSIIHRTGRGRTEEGGVSPSPDEVLDAVTRAGAHSVGAGAEIGSIAIGKKADLAVIDLNVPALRPLIRLVSNIVHYGHPGIVHSVMVDGAFVMRDRKVLTIDEDALVAEADTVVRRVWERMQADNPDIARPSGELNWLGG
ncbi:amidohydrolase family protein [Phreatobacter sp. AB_2022a]|uniref:amidohydrolase family protein n=1 Tax=Phreatobacter sp. AB_2022a TaxID=3003134 RepID=UPI0022873FF8|nr:amidohydrolase family protein [Phreatobacter sp. AB_2022a]MCZ0733514.1 amidohydrolase family protein [Phreatobacter sp. AB_2022a]